MPRHRLNSAVRRGRAAIAKGIAPRPAVTDTYYPQQPTCQIKNLWVILESFFGQRQDGFFVEVGAFDGVTYSNTWGLAVRGWSGLLIEPIPESAAAARAAHADHKGVQVIQTAIGSVTGHVDLTAAGAFTSESTAMIDSWESLTWRRRGPRVRVPVTTLDDVLARYARAEEIDLLVVDVEGGEAQVMAGFSWPHEPGMVILELSDLHPSPVHRSHAASGVRDGLLDRGYGIAYKDAINTVFVRQDLWRGFADRP